MTFSDGEKEIWPIFAIIFAVMLIIALVVCYCTCKSKKQKSSVHASDDPVYIVPGAGLVVKEVMPTGPPSYEDVIRNCDLNNYVMSGPPPSYRSLEFHLK